MFIHIGKGKSVPLSDIIGIFDLNDPELHHNLLENEGEAKGYSSCILTTTAKYYSRIGVSALAARLDSVLSLDKLQNYLCVDSE